MARARRSLRLVLLFSGIVISSCRSRNQKGAIEGHVSGASGISIGKGGSSTESQIVAIPNANVTIKNASTLTVQTIQADFNGNFRVEGLAAGRYEVSFAAKPFKQQVHTINVRPGETADASTRMLIGRDPFEIAEISGCPVRPVGGAPPPDLSTAEIHLRRRGGCLGPCPVYSVHLYSDGRVEYRGDLNVGVLGITNYRAAPSAILALARKFYELGFFNFCASYRTRATDQPSVDTSIRLASLSMEVSVFGDAAP